MHTAAAAGGFAFPPPARRHSGCLLPTTPPPEPAPAGRGPCPRPSIGPDWLGLFVAASRAATGAGEPAGQLAAMAASAHGVLCLAERARSEGAKAATICLLGAGVRPLGCVFEPLILPSRAVLCRPLGNGCRPLTGLPSMESLAAFIQRWCCIDTRPSSTPSRHTISPATASNPTHAQSTYTDRSTQSHKQRQEERGLPRRLRPLAKT